MPTNTRVLSPGLAWWKGKNDPSVLCTYAVVQMCPVFTHVHTRTRTHTILKLFLLENGGGKGVHEPSIGSRKSTIPSQGRLRQERKVSGFVLGI